MFIAFFFKSVSRLALGILVVKSIKQKITRENMFFLNKQVLPVAIFILSPD